MQKQESPLSEQDRALLKSKGKQYRIFRYVSLFGIFATVAWGISSFFASGQQEGSSTLFIVCLVFFTVIFWMTNRQGKSTAKDMQEGRKITYSLTVERKKEEDDGDLEIRFGQGAPIDDIEVTRDVFEKIAVGDVCIVTLAPHSRTVLSAMREGDGLVLTKK